MILPPHSTEHPPYFENYIKLVNGNNALKALSEGISQMQNILSHIDNEKENVAYAPGKWTIKEVIGHVIDTERIMAYRALCIARGETQSLPGFDENVYVKNADFHKHSLIDMSQEFMLMRESNILLFKSFDENTLNKKGTANKNSISVRSLIYIIAGHQVHHINVIRERYLGK